MPVESVVNVLWSGGWDSTFRVLDLVLRQGATVQPHYILALDRVRGPHELMAIQTIRQEVIARDGDAGQRLRPLRIVLAGDLDQNDSISDTWHAIRRRRVFSGQYLWLNLYAAQLATKDLEIGFNKDDARKYGMSPSMRRASAANGAPSWILPETHGDPDLVLFERFSYPLVELTKPDMQAIAERSGFGDLMQMTWFCMMPIGDRPCGHCRTCRDSIKGGMIDRFPTMSRVRYRYWRIFHAFYLLKDQRMIVGRRLMDRVTGRQP